MRDEWDELFVGIDAVAELPRLKREWLCGLGAHPSPDVVTRLVGRVRHLPAYRLPAEAVDAVIAHPDWRLRADLAEHQRGMSLAQWVRLIATEPTGVRRRRLQHMAGWHCPRPSGGEFERWAADRDPQVRLQALWFRRPPASVVAALAGDPDPQVRAAVCEQAWPHLDAERRAALSTDPSPDVRDAADRRAGRERPMSRSEYDALDSTEQWRARSRQHLDDDLARHLLDDPEYAPRATLAGNPWLSPELVAELAEDDDYRVRDRVAVRPDATEELRARITSRVPEYHSYYRVEWVEDLHDDPEAMRRLARSASVAVRRSVARARLLPPDVLDLLARDPDSGVRSDLASHNEHAPAEVLLEAAVEWTRPGPVLRRPDFPRDALIGFADHPDPMRRRLAPDAPDATAELVERLADDPDGRVRLRAAADPRLSPATALRLLAGTEQEYRAFHDHPGRAVPETHSLREAVIGNPRLPVAALVGLLRDPHSARDAAANPAVPAAVAHRMIDLACGEG